MSKEVQLISRLFSDLATGEGATLNLCNRFSDIFVKINTKLGELSLYENEDEVLASTTIFSWISQDNNEGISQEMREQLREAIAQLESKGLWDKEVFTRPFSIVLVSDSFETIEELLYLDDEHILLTSPLLSGLDEELDAFIHELLQDSK